MDETLPPFPWGLAATGLACVALGVAFLRTRWLHAVVRAQGGAPLSPREAHRVPAALTLAGTLALVGCWGMTWPFAHGQRPFWVVIAATASVPLAVLLILGIALYLVLLRRLR